MRAAGVDAAEVKGQSPLCGGRHVRRRHTTEHKNAAPSASGAGFAHASCGNPVENKDSHRRVGRCGRVPKEMAL
jgi:hypothetical protein